METVHDCQFSYGVWLMWQAQRFGADVHAGGRLRPFVRAMWLIVLMCGSGTTSLFAADDGAAPLPNIVVIMADDLGYGDLGCYGQTRIATPNIDRLAVEGLKFTNYYAGACVCAPSRYVLMTGIHTGRGFIRGNSQMSLRVGDVTVAEVLKRAGYRTGMFGKWGLGQEKNRRHPDGPGVR